MESDGLTRPTATASCGLPRARITPFWGFWRATPNRCCGSRGPATTTTSPVRCTPELRLSGYSIEDIVMHDALLDAVEDAVLDVVVAPA
jgi:hypothetical protein